MPVRDFRGPIDEATLRHILSRAATVQNLHASDSRDDDLRMLAELDVSFAGRAAYVWIPAEDDEAHFASAADCAAAAHARLPRLVLQAAVFEAVYPGMDAIPVPGWVFEAFGEAVEHRTFRFADCVSPEFARRYPWPQFGVGGFVPDLTLMETRRWFYYRARRYIDAGYEALHLGQPHLYAGRDPGYHLLADLCQRLRQYAAVRARRRWLLLDAHTHGIRRGGQLLFDLHSRPLSAVPDLSRPDDEDLILQFKGHSLGGTTPAGWTCRQLPYLIEIDNWGGRTFPLARWAERQARARQDRWGYDDIGWFAHRASAERDAFLKYAFRWLRCQDPDAFFQMPLARLLGEAPVAWTAADGSSQQLHYYNANTPSAGCPHGFGQEAAIATLWAEPAPPWLARLRHDDAGAVQLESGQDAAGPVYVVGEVQEALGVPVGDTCNRHCQLFHQGEGVFARAFVLPRPGSWRLVLNVGGTMTEVYRHGGLAGGEPFLLRSSASACEVLLRFDYACRQLQALDRTGRDLLLGENQAGMA